MSPPDTGPLSVADAARILGISKEAVRKRLDRGTLRGAKRGRVWVVSLTAADIPPDAGYGMSRDDHGERSASPDMVAVLRDDVKFLRNELAERTEEIRRRDHIIAGLVERVRELPATTEDAPTAHRSGPQAGDRPDVDPTPMMPVSDTLALGWRRWFRRITDQR